MSDGERTVLWILDTFSFPLSDFLPGVPKLLLKRLIGPLIDYGLRPNNAKTGNLDPLRQ